MFLPDKIHQPWLTYALSCFPFVVLASFSSGFPNATVDDNGFVLPGFIWYNPVTHVDHEQKYCNDVLGPIEGPPYCQVKIQCVRRLSRLSLVKNHGSWDGNGQGRFLTFFKWSHQGPLPLVSYLKWIDRASISADLRQRLMPSNPLQRVNRFMSSHETA